MTLANILEKRRLTVDEVVVWSADLSSELSALHERGECHGDVTAENVAIENNRSALLPPADPSNSQAPNSQASNSQASSSQPADIVQFAGLLSQMLEAATVDSDAARAQWHALDQIANSNALAVDGSRMKKVALALRLVRLTRREEIPAPVLPQRRSKRVLMLVREVDQEQSNPRRFNVSTVQVGAFLASVASVAVGVCILFLKLWK